MKMAKLEAAAFNTAKQGDDLEKLKAFVKKYPSSSLKGTAEKQIAAIVNKTFEAEWFEASESQNPKLLAAFIKKHGKSAKAEGAKQNYEQAVAFWRSLKPGDTFKDCGSCAEMVVIPAGGFHRKGDTSNSAQNIRIGYSFAVSRHEVTQQSWYTTMGGLKPSRYGSSSLREGQERFPVRVGWKNANSFVSTLSVKTGQRYRLLSETEWEYMARAGSSAKFPWGTEKILACQLGQHDADSWRVSTKFVRRIRRCRQLKRMGRRLL